MTFASEHFEGDIAKHEMQVIRDDGVNRHIRFKRPGTMAMHFDVLTWPGYLCYTGDMGTYVFSRLLDMFEFFRRRESSEPYRMDVRYWAEKLEAEDCADGSRRWSEKQFEKEVRAYFERATCDEDEWPQARKDALWAEIDEQVCTEASQGEAYAWAALSKFDHEGFRFDDWERDCKVWTHRFLWCCHALEWAIGTYDSAKSAAPAVAA